MTNDSKVTADAAARLERMIATPAEAAQMLGLSMPSIYALIHRDIDPLPYFNVGRKIMIPISSLQTWLQRQTEKSA